LGLGEFKFTMKDDKIVRLCDRDGCLKLAVYFASPVGSPDEPALCEKHFDELIYLQEKIAKEGVSKFG